jgi:hypothetical protein
MKLTEAFKIVSIPVIIASLCCLSPVMLVLLGLSTVGFAASLSDTFYGEYKWYFRLTGLLALILAYTYHLRRQGICTLDQAKRERNRIVNGLLVTLIAGILGYLFFLYVVVEYLGRWLQIWK